MSYINSNCLSETQTYSDLLYNDIRRQILIIEQLEPESVFAVLLEKSLNNIRQWTVGVKQKPTTIKWIIRHIGKYAFLCFAFLLRKEEKINTALSLCQAKLASVWLCFQISHTSHSEEIVPASTFLEKPHIVLVFKLKKETSCVNWWALELLSSGFC